MAEVSLCGPRLRGARKYLGGSPNLDGSALVGIPSHAAGVLRVALPSGAVTLQEEKLPVPPPRHRRGRFKWLRGVLTPDGSIFGIPACADAVLRIHPDGRCSMLGRELIRALPPGEWMWHGAAVGGDGNIYAIPANAERVLKIEPRTGLVSCIGPRLHPGLTSKWYGGIKALDGSIWGIPYNAPSALKITPATGEVEEVGQLGVGGWKWHGGLRSGQFLVGIPSHSDYVLRIDPATHEVALFHTGIVGGRYKWAGGVEDRQGNVWAVPGDSAYALKIVPSTGHVTVIGGLPHEKNKWQNGVCGRDGNVYCIPCDAAQVLCIHTRSGELSLHGELGPRVHKFQGAYAAADGLIWALPENCAHVMRIAPPEEDDCTAARLPSWRAGPELCAAARLAQRRWRAKRGRKRGGGGGEGRVEWHVRWVEAGRATGVEAESLEEMLAARVEARRAAGVEVEWREERAAEEGSGVGVGGDAEVAEEHFERWRAWRVRRGVEARVPRGEAGAAPRRGGGGVALRQLCDVVFHASEDFRWEELRDRVEPLVRGEAATRRCEARATSPVEQIAGWEAHFRKHATAFERSGSGFFKPRRFLLSEFPMLRAECGMEGSLRVLEVGAGNGSSALPLLLGNPHVRVHASDPSAAAVEQTRRGAEECGVGARLTTEVQRTAATPCSVGCLPFDLAMIVFTLSAVPGDGDVALLRETAQAVRAGGAILLRDYGVFDHRHLVDARRSQPLCGATPYEYIRPGGMHRRYYSLERISELAAAVGLVLEELRYLCVRLHNVKKQLTRDRCYVHAVLRK